MLQQDGRTSVALHQFYFRHAHKSEDHIFTMRLSQ